ncbi:BrnT family toxin [Scytonema hofmannii FACHB-248]|uniref:BrnT family toxin n=1 Tax=Scytonema hofmannii FACHB-248 TaxID=1842502 RepID=A0ABR8GLK8_9CYAN|nr:MULTISPECIES: BrnT family toxin [Nostocales]MBD2604287.1 BrnT family toxin [Scytonema hofmannii FACHB-248]
MNFEWDEQKNEINIDKHGFDFADAYRIFNLPMAVDLDERSDYGEDRWIGTGMLDGRIIVVIYTELNEETIRIISLRKALSHERKRYEQYLKNRLV